MIELRQPEPEPEKEPAMNNFWQAIHERECASFSIGERSVEIASGWAPVERAERITPEAADELFACARSDWHALNVAQRVNANLADAHYLDSTGPQLLANLLASLELGYDALPLATRAALDWCLRDIDQAALDEAIAEALRYNDDHPRQA